MYASIRAYRFGSGSIDGLMHRVDRDFADALSMEPGFVGHQTIATGGDTVVSISLFRTAGDVQRTDDLAAQWVAEDLAEFDVEPTLVSSGEVMVSRGTSDLLEYTHH